MITCNECNGDCCRILVVEVATPKSKEDFENIKYYFFHDDIRVYLDTDNAWNVQFNTKCEYLDKEGKCMMYEQRPPVCRNSLTEHCHKNIKEIKKFFNDIEEYENYLDYLKSISPSK